MKLYKDYTKEPFSFLVNDAILPSDNSLRFMKNLWQNDCSEKIKRINNKINQNKVQYKLVRETVKILALSLGNVGKCNFLKGEDVFSEKGLLEKNCNS